MKRVPEGSTEHIYSKIHHQVISRIQGFLDEKEKEAFGIFQQRKAQTKLKKFKNVAKNTTKYGHHSFTVLGPHIWNSLPEEIKQLPSLNTFKNYIKSWCGQKSKCYLCQKPLEKTYHDMNL